MRPTIVFVCILLIVKVTAQSKRPILKFAPLALIDEVSFPTIQGGVEFRLLKKIGVYNEAGIKYRRSYYDNTDTSFYPSKGFKLKTELRYYFRFRGRSDEYYIAANGFYTKDYHDNRIGYYFQSDTAQFRTDEFGVKKSVGGTNLIFGGHHYIFKKLLLDYYTGFGIRFRKLLTIGKEFNSDRDQIRGPIDLTVSGIRNEIDAGIGDKAVVNFSLGIRLGFQF